MGAPTIFKEASFRLSMQRVDVHISGTIYRPGTKDEDHTGHMKWTYEDGTVRQFILDKDLWEWIEDVLYPLAYWEERTDHLMDYIADNSELKNVVRAGGGRRVTEPGEFVDTQAVQDAWEEFTKLREED
jgi:hypothetical protein